MFIQLIQGKVRDEAGLRRCMDRWTEELQPGATGYLGHTCGMSDNDIWVCLARFESAEAARRNGERPEQDRWWAETRQCFEGDITFMDCPDVTEWLGGGSDDAGFVQVMEGHTSDARRLRELLDRSGPRVHELRPEILGGTFGTYGEDGYVEAVYFTAEGAAREHEHIEVPDDLRSLFEEERRLAGEIRYYDLHEPTLVSAPR
jgi:hypothetical protein